jgi:hypothetical protein
MRQCGSCTLCCKLIPVKEIGKPAGVRCEHQRMGKGCAIYDKRPWSCRLWDCQWLRSDADLPRPDHGHFVIDTQLDYITATDEHGTVSDVPVIQIWVDPKFPDAHRDKRLRKWLDKMGEEKGLVGIVRYSSTEAFILVPPSRNHGEWLELTTSIDQKRDEHSFRDRVATLNRIMTEGETRR